MKIEQVAQDRKEYSRPQLVKHGKVESMTLGQQHGSTSQPCYDE